MLKKDEVMMYPSSVKTIKLTEELNTFILNMRYLKKNLTLFFKKSRFLPGVTGFEPVSYGFGDHCKAIYATHL